MGNWLGNCLGIRLIPDFPLFPASAFDNQSGTVGITESLWNWIPYF